MHKISGDSKSIFFFFFFGLVSNLEHFVFCRARGRGRGRGKRRFGPGRRPGRPPKFMRMEVTSENGEKCEEGTQVYLGGQGGGKNKYHVGCKLLKEFGASVQIEGVLWT